MCGIVGYFGGAGNSLTRLLTGMSAIIYRAPDSTGIGVFGDDREPIRLRKSLGSVVQLLNVLQSEAVYTRPESLLSQVLVPDARKDGPKRQQQCLLDFEGFDHELDESKADIPDFDALVDLETEHPARLFPGRAGKALFKAEYSIRSRKDLSSLINSLITAFDLSPLAIHTFYRRALIETIARRRAAGLVNAADDVILTVFDDLFEATRVGARVRHLRHRAPRHLPKPPNARKELWQCLIETVVRIPDDYNRDGVCCLFRLLDAALLSRMAAEPALAEELDRVLDMMWLPSQRPHRVDWRTLYAAEKGLNVYGWAGAAALTFLQREVFFPAVTADMARNSLMTDESVVPGRTDPMLLRYLATPIIAHGRWAIQSAITEKNAHPFLDTRRQRALALNGQFDSRVETRLRTFLESVAGYRLRSDNSAEYAALLWGHFYDQLSLEQQRSELVRQQVENDMADIAMGSQAIDFKVYHGVRDRTPADLDRMAFIAAVQQIVRKGGQIAVAGISLVSPQRLYVAGHNRPVFIVRRLENDDFMVVSDINAALGLFPQVLVEETIKKLEQLKRSQTEAVARMAGDAPDREMLRTFADSFARERERLLESFAVEVYPLDGEEIFALIETVLEGGTVRRTVSISDFDGNILPEVEPFETKLDPVTVRKDVDKSFHETHLGEVPERFRYILHIYSSDAPANGPVIDLRTRVLRRRFGRRLEGLRRLILVGTGSAFNMATIAQHFLADLLPDIAIDALRPGEIENPRRRILPQQDLVILLSWSSTTAEMVQLTQRLLSKDILMIGITEKRFADMALTAGKSAGVMPIFSGEEVTVAGIKSTLCMLLCVNLLGAWICAEKDLAMCMETVFNRINDLADRIEQLNDDTDIVAFSKQTAAAMAGADAIVVVSAPEAAGTGREITLKLEEAGWYAVGKWYSYGDIQTGDPGLWSPGRFVIVHATRRAHIEAAIAAMQRLADAGVEFTVLTCPNRHQERIKKLCDNCCMVLPWTDDFSQPYIDIAFYYRLALDFSLVCGHGIGVGPRNRAKSSTVTRTRSKKLLAPAAELRHMDATTPGLVSVDSDGERPGVSLWENEVDEPEPIEVFAGLRRLAVNLRQNALLKDLVAFDAPDLRELGRLFFDHRSEVNDAVIAALDSAAGGAVRDAVAVWRRLINLPIRELPAGEWPHQAAGETLLLAVATVSTKTDDSRKTMMAEESLKIGWLGPKPPSWLEANRMTAGRFIIPTAEGQCSPSQLYAALVLLLTEAWSYHEHQKAEIVRRHIAGAADAITDVLNDGHLLAELRKTAKANAGYRTAFFISPFTGSGRVWESLFDNTGRVMMVYHEPGHSGHGPIVTIDGAVDQKYVALESRTDMVARYGESEVAGWEKQCLHGNNIDTFLAGSPTIPQMRPRAPFYAGEQWYLPLLQPDYDTHRDNLIILDMTAERDLPRMLDELSLLGSRVPRLVIITQAERIREAGEKALFSFPITNLLVLPSLHGAPIPDMHLPFVLNAVGTALAAAWKTT